MNKQLWTPQLIIGLIGMAIVAGTVAAVFVIGDVQLRSQTVGGVMSLGGMVAAYYFGSSHGSQDKDATLARAQELLAVSTPPASTSETVTQPSSFSMAGTASIAPHQPKE